MKNTFSYSLLVLFAALTSCGESMEIKQARLDSIQETYQNPWNETQAELIVGKPVRFSEAGASDMNMWYSHSAKFVSDSADSSGRLSSVEFTFLEFIVTDSAIRSYSLNKAYYQKEGPTEEIAGIGEEAFFQTDDSLFYFLMARKGSRELRIKSDSISVLATKENFIAAARQIMEAM